MLDFPVLVGDVGATNARFCLLGDSSSSLDVVHSLKTSDYPTIEDSILSVMSDEKIGSVLLAVAAPVVGDVIEFTNCPWRIDPESFLQRLGCSHLVLFNDFLAQALALPFLGDDSVTPLGDFSVSFDTETPCDTMVVLGPGTGLGVSALVRAGVSWVPLGGEGGHVDLGPRTDSDIELWRIMREAYSTDRLSAEMILSGPSICRIYSSVCEMNSVSSSLDTPESITSSALSGESPEAVSALRILCELLGRLSGDLALTFMADRIYISGGIAPKILPFFDNFRRGFEDKPPHSELLASIPTWVITSPTNALDGLCWYVRSPDSFLLHHRGWRL